MQKIVPCLWYDADAEGAVDLYVSVFNNSKRGSLTRYGEASAKVSGMPVGSVLTVDFEIEGMRFVALNGGPVFKFNPSVSFLVACRTKEEVDAIWKKLSSGGTALMELGKYPFSDWYGWTTDRFGLSWQVMLMGHMPMEQKITPTLMFVGEQAGKAEAAIKLYTSVFRNSRTGDILRYGRGEDPDKEGTIKHGGFTLEGQEFAAMDSAHPHNFAFNEAVSLSVECLTQEEIDHYWDGLTANGGQESVCGWLKDRFGVSWQVAPTVLNDMLRDPDPKKVERVTEAFLKMKKLDLKAIEQAYRGS